jgi:hypothetical protein
MPYWLNPGYYRYGLNKGMSGTDVAALQINLPGLNIDGKFGNKTFNVVKDLQDSGGLQPVDGIVGPKTFQFICVEKATPAARKYNLPVGMAKSIMFGESNFIVGASGPHPSDAGYDIGAFELSSGPNPPSQDFMYASYDVAQAAEFACNHLRYMKDHMPEPIDSSYLTFLANGDKELFKWQMAVLSHNWPQASYYIPKYGHIFTDPARDDETQQWIVSASGGTMSTPRQWVTNYVQKNTLYVKF